jgi:hypothetical protein
MKIPMMTKTLSKKNRNLNIMMLMIIVMRQEDQVVKKKERDSGL